MTSDLYDLNIDGAQFSKARGGRLAELHDGRPMTRGYAIW